MLTPAPAAARRPALSPARPIGLVCVVLLHLGLAWMLRDASTWRPRQTHAAVDVRPVAVRILPTSMPTPGPGPNSTPASTKQQATARPRASEPPPAARTAARRPRPPTPSVEQRPSFEPPSFEPPVSGSTVTPAAQAITLPAPPQHASAAASATTAPASLLDSDATLRAIRASARSTSIAERAAAASNEPAPVSRQDRISASMAAAAKGDCAKGEYLGAGMGVLSLPFLAAAALRGQCSPR